MNEKDSFIIEDLDDHHLVIKADEEYRVRKELETEVRDLVFQPLHDLDPAGTAGEEYIQLRVIVHGVTSISPLVCMSVMWVQGPYYIPFVENSQAIAYFVRAVGSISDNSEGPPRDHQ